MNKKNRSAEILLYLSKFFGPVFLGFGVLGSVGLLLSEQLRMTYWPLLTAYFFPPLGKESIIPFGISQGIHPVLMALSIAFIDIVVALFLVWNYDLAKEIPLVGSFMKKVEEKGRGVEDKYGWIKPLRFIGIVLFVIIPFQGSGGMVGSIVGRLIGMTPRNTFLAICIGAVTGTLLIAAFSNAFFLLASYSLSLSIGLLALVIITAVSYYVLKKRKKQRSSKHE